MTFKVNWERAHTQHTLPDNVIREMLKITYPDNAVNDYNIISGGCANINVKVQLKGLTSPIVLRVYLRDPKAAYREHKISQLLLNKVPTPKTYHIGHSCGYTFAITEYLSGNPLRDYLLNDQDINLKNIMFKVGNMLSKIADIQFDKSGWLDSELNVTERITQESMLAFCKETLNSEKLTAILAIKKRQQIDDVLTRHASLFPDGHERNLVHADFDPANILVNKINGILEITGIIDWEFSFSGSTLHDVASMLRYAHHMPPGYNAAFIKGLRSGEYTLPDNWNASIQILNLLSLLDCLQRSDLSNSPNRVADIQELIVNIIQFFN